MNWQAAPKTDADLMKLKDAGKPVGPPEYPEATLAAANQNVQNMWAFGAE